MTEKLKTLLHERADHVDFAVPDLEAMVRDGDRRIRRRRTGLVAAIAAAAVAGVLLVPQLGGPDRAERRTDVAVQPSTSGRQLTWATGRVIHSSGGDSVDVGHEVAAYVETSVGFVVSDASGRVWSVRGGDVTAVGRVDDRQPHLAADAASPWVGWVEPRDGGAPVFAIYNQSTGDRRLVTERTTPGMGTTIADPDPAYVYDIDGDTAYLREAGGAVAEDLVTGERTLLDPGADDGFEVLDAQDGLVAFNAADAGTALGRTRETALMLRGVHTDLGAFSPGAGYYTSDADQPEVYDARSGQRISFDLDYRFASGYEWLDAHTLAMIAQEEPSSSVQLLTCRVPEGSCAVAVDGLGSFDDLAAEGFQLPIGDRIDH